MLYRTHRTPPGISTEAYPIPGYGYNARIDLTELSCKCMKVVQNSHTSYRTHRGFRVGYVVQNSQTLSGTGMMLCRTQNTYLSVTGNSRVNTPSIQKVNAMFSRVRSSYKSYKTVK